MPYAEIIINPIAGAGKTIKQWPEIKEFLTGTGLDFKSQMTDSPGHAIELAAQAVKRNTPVIISIGGDGTINEIVNGIHQADGLSNVMLGIISTGTGADYIRSVGISRSYREAGLKFKNPKTRTVDLGMVDCVKNDKSIKRLFVNFAGLGFDAEIVKATSQRFKAFGKVSAYLLALFYTLIFYSNKNITMEIGGSAEKMKICTVIMGNGKYGGGGMLTTPEAELDDGLLDILIIGNLSKPDLLKSLPMIYKGTVLSHPKVTLKKAREVIIHPDITMSIQADGDIVGESPATFHIIDSALRVII